MEDELKPKKVQKKTVLAFGEGEDEKIFLRHLDKSYCRRDKVTVSSSSAGGGSPMNVVQKAVQYRRGIKRDSEFVVLDTDIPWSKEMKEYSEVEGLELIGNAPCLEAFFLDILESELPWKNSSTKKCKEYFAQHCKNGYFDEDECIRLFPKALLNSARGRVAALDRMIKIIEQGFGDPEIK